MQVRWMVDSSSRSALTRAAILALAAGSLLSHGCSRSDPHASGIASGSAKLQANSGGAFASPYDQVDSKNYRETITIAKPIADSAGTSPQGAAAASLMADAQLGQVQGVLDQAALSEQIALEKVTMIRVLMSNWLGYNVEADSAAGFDPTAMIATITTDRAEREKEVQTLETQLQDLQRQITDLRAKAKSRFEEAAKLGEEFSKAREAIGTTSAGEAESRLATARESKRKGDAIRIEASRFQSQAEVLQPEADETALLIAATRNRIAGLDREKMELSEKAQQGRAAASQSQTAAAETAKQIEAALAELATFRSSDVNVKFDNAISALRTAAASARTASSDSSGGGKLLTGRVQLSLAGALASKASSLAIYTALLREAATIQPPLPFAASVATSEKEAAELAKASTDEAKSAYEAAQSAFSSVQLKGPGASAIKERLSLLADAIGILAGNAAPSESPVEAAPAEQPPATEAAPAAAPAQSAAPADAGAAWEEIYGVMKSGDKEAFFKLVKLQDPAHEQTLTGILLLGVAQEKLDAACTSKFGKSLTEVQASAMGVTPPNKASDYTVDVQGESATISHPASPAALKLVQENGKWLLDSSSFANGQIAMIAQMAGPLSSAMESITIDVEGGKITKVEDVIVELQKRAMAGAKPGGGG